MDGIQLMIQTTRELTLDLENLQYCGDLSDAGNEIGIVIGKAIEKYKSKLGWELEDFISGIKHGVSLVDGTH